MRKSKIYHAKNIDRSITHKEHAAHTAIAIKFFKCSDHNAVFTGKESIFRFVGSRLRQGCLVPPLMNINGVI